MKSASSALPFHFSSTEFESFKSKVRQQIDDMTDLQVRMLVSSVFVERDKEKSEANIDQDLIEIRDSWIQREDLALSEADHIGCLNHTMQVAFDYFAQQGLTKDSLRSDSNFASYISSWFESNQAQSFKIMHDFCDYLCQLSLKSPEQQEIYLQSFPPDRDYLKCLDGTEERIDKLYKHLVTKEKFQPFLQAHDVTILRAVASLKDHVHPNNEVHLPNYLEYSLGLVSKKVIHPQSQIPFTASLKIHKDYPRHFKQLLVTKILEEIDERKNGIEKEINGIATSFPALNFDHSRFNPDITFFNGFKDLTLFSHINNILDPYSDSSLVGSNFFEEDDRGSFVLSHKLLLHAATSNPALQVLNIFLARENVAKLPREISIKQEALEALEADGSEIFFSAHGMQNILKLLEVEESARQESINHQELLFAVESLWMMGENLAGNCPFSFVEIDRTLNRVQGNYLNERVAHEIEPFLPNQVEKIRRIREKVDLYDADPNVITFFTQPAQAQIGNLFYGNASKEIIFDSIKMHTDATSLFSELNDSLLSLNSPQSYYLACQNLVLRPDCLEILQAFDKKIVDKVSDARLPEDFIRKCLENAACHNSKDVFKKLLKFVSSSEIFAENDALHFIARHNSADLIRDIIPYLSEEDFLGFLQYIDDDENTVAAVAASCDSADVLRALCEAFRIDDLNHTFHRNGNGLAHIAADNGSSKVIKLLGELNLSTNLLISKNNDGDTPAHYATANAIEALREAGVQMKDFNIKNNDGLTPLQNAVFYNKKDVVMALGKELVLSTGDILHFAAVNNCANMIETLLDLGVDLNAKNDYGNAAIHLALNKNNAEFVIALGKAGADLKIANSKGDRPLQIALLSRSADMIKALGEGGFCFYDTNDHDDNMMHQIASLKNESNACSCIKVLHDAGIDFSRFNKPNLDGNLPVVIAALEGKVDITRAFDDVGIGVNQHDSKGCPLIYRIACFNKSIIPSLISVGANIDYQNEVGDTALHVAVYEKNIDALRTLIMHGADLNLQNEDDDTPLYRAASQGYNSLMPELSTKESYHTTLQLALIKKDLYIVRYLIKFNQNFANARGNDYLNMAVTQGNIPIIESLLKSCRIDINALSSDGYKAIQCLDRIENAETKREVERCLITNGAIIDRMGFLKDAQKFSKSLERIMPRSNAPIPSLAAQGSSIHPPSTARVLNTEKLDTSSAQKPIQRKNN
jgi:ankyrin repeat protein